MGIIRAAIGSVNGMYQDVWREYFICPSLSQNTLMVRVYKATGENSGNNGSNDVISNKSIIVVNEGQSAIVVSQGRVIAVYDKPGENLFEDPDTKGAKGIARDFGRRFAFAGEVAPVTQRVYVVNTKECMGMPFGTPAPIPVHVEDRKTGLVIDGSVSISGTYSYRVADAAKFYKFSGTVIGGVCNAEYISTQLEGEMKKALHGAVHKVTASGVRPSELPGHVEELCDFVKQEVTEKWCSARGLEIVSLALGSIVSTDTQMVQDVQYASALAGKPYDYFEIDDDAVIRAGYWRCECGAYTVEENCPFCGKSRSR